MITFIIPSIGRPTLQRAIDSLYDQTMQDWKAIIVYDGVKNILQNYDKNRITVVEAKQRKNAGAMRNIALSMVDTKWIGFVDDDDVLYERYIEELKKQDETNENLGFILFRMLCNKVTPNRNIKHEIVFNETGISFAVKNSVIKKHNLLFGTHKSEDFYFLQTLAKYKEQFIIPDYVAYEVCRSHRDKKTISRQINFIYKNKTINFWIHNNECLSNAIEHDKKFYEVEVLEYLLQNYPVQKTIIDAGANMGNHSLFFHHFLQYQEIHCFEPIISNFEILTKNLDKICKLHQIALSNFNGYSNMKIDLKNMGGCRIVNDNKEIEVDTKTIDSFGFKDVSLINVDTEGTELEVLQGAKETIFLYKPLVIIETNTRASTDYLEKLGYQCEKKWEKHLTNLFKHKELI